MERSKLIEKLTGIFRSILKNNELVISDELTADDVKEWDSLTHMILITTIENKFRIKFKLRELNKLKDVGSLIELIQLKLKEL